MAQKKQATKQTQLPPEENYTSMMRVYGGVVWGSLLAGAIALLCVLIPLVPNPQVWSGGLLWAGLVSLGILLQWFVARGKCPKCGRELTVPPTLTKCPQCQSYLKAINRKIVKVG